MHPLKLMGLMPLCHAGLNCAESISFAPADWLRFSGLSVGRYRSFRQPGLFSQDQLLLQVDQLLQLHRIWILCIMQQVCGVLQGDACELVVLMQVLEREDSVKVARRAVSAMERLVHQQLEQRYRLWDAGAYVCLWFCHLLLGRYGRQEARTKCGSCCCVGAGVLRSHRMSGDAEGAGQEASCAACHQDCYLAGLQCDCCPGR